MTSDKPPRNDDIPKDDKLRLVADNDPARIAERQRQTAANDARDQAAASLAILVANLLRVLAGAGEPLAVHDNLLKASEHFREATMLVVAARCPGSKI